MGVLAELLMEGLRRGRQDRALAELEVLARRRAGMPAEPGAVAGALPSGAGRGRGVAVDGSGAVRDLAGWFLSAPSLPWAHDSENFFTGPVAPTATGAAPSAEGARVSAPAPLPPSGAAAARVPPTGGAQADEWDPGDELRYIAAAKQAGIDPRVFEEILDARLARERQARVWESDELDPYGRANLAFGRSATGPWRQGAYGTVNAATGETRESPYAAAAAERLAAQADRDRAAAEKDRAPWQFGTWGAGNRFSGEMQASPYTQARTLAELERAGAYREQGRNRRRVQLEDGRLVEAEEGDDGRLRVVPIVDEAGEPVRGVVKRATPAREFERGKSPRQVLVERYEWHLENDHRRDPEGAMAAAQEEVGRLFGAAVPVDVEPGPGPGVPRPEPAGVRGAEGFPRPEPARADPVEAALADLDRELAEAVRARPDAAGRLRAMAEERRRAILAAAGVGG